MSGLIAQSFLDELLSRTDIAELVDTYVPLKKQGNSHVACCPFHHEKSPSFHVIPRKQFYYCFGCGASGNALSFLMQHLNQDFVTAVETLAERYGMTIPREESSAPKKTSKTSYTLLEQVSQYYQQQLHKNKEVQAYLHTRGISAEIAARYQLGYAPDAWHSLEQQFPKSIDLLVKTGMLIQNDAGKRYDRYRHRLIFPIQDKQGHIIGFGGRSIDPQTQPKYLNSPETPLFQKNRELYGLYPALQQSTLEACLVVEGYIDVITLAQYGIPQAVATLGTATSAQHIQLLQKYVKRIVFCFDGDNAGRKAAWRALEITLPYLNSALDVRFCFLPAEHDPDSLLRTQGKEAFLAHIKRALPANEWFWEKMLQGINISELAGKTALVHASKPYLNDMPNGAYKALLLEELATKTHLTPKQINSLMKADDNAKKPTATQPAAAASSQMLSVERHPVRLALALLLQNPGLYARQQAHIDINAHQKSGQKLLYALLHSLSKSPHLQSATLVEMWRGTPLFEPMSKLACVEHQIPEDKIETAFLDILSHLKKQNVEEDIQKLLQKLRQQGLNSEEKQQLQALMQEKKNPSKKTTR
ncbi:MAG: DNA primase [Legionellaceae bacterium]|nr:DNA primase [Legionellaceae bacterium]